MPSYAVGDIVARKGQRVGVVTDLLPSGGIVLRCDDPVAMGLRPPCNCDVLGPARLTGLEVIGRDEARHKRERERQATIAVRAGEVARADFAREVGARASAGDGTDDILRQLSMFG